jgi:hypothetical protein
MIRSARFGLLRIRQNAKSRIVCQNRT